MADLRGANNPNYKGHMHRKCRQCGGPIGGSSATRKYCSRECQAAAQRAPKNIIPCKHCGKDFYSRRQAKKFCSTGCATAFRAINPPKEPGRRKRREERRSEQGGGPLPIGRPKSVRVLRACGTCGKGMSLRPSEVGASNYCSKECYAKSVGPRQSGEKHHNYKHGKTQDRESERQAVRRHPMYRAWRTAVFERDGHTCRSCLAKGGELRAHHHAPWADDVRGRLKVSNGITLCAECHRLWHLYHRRGLFVGKEALLQKKIQNALVEYGFWVFNVPGTAMGTNGRPDLVVSFAGMFGGIECKVYPNYLSELQRCDAERIMASGGLYYVAQSEDDIGRIIELFEIRSAAGHWTNTAATTLGVYLPENQRNQ